MKRDVQWNADYDMKRKLVGVRDVDGLITADTVPWRSIDEFEQARNLLDDWRRSQRRVLKTKTGLRGHDAPGARRGPAGERPAPIPTMRCRRSRRQFSS